MPVRDFSGIISLEEFKYKCHRKHYQSRVKKPSIERAVTDRLDEGDEFAKEHKNGSKGWSFTFGRQTSSSQLYIYDKKAEMDRNDAVLALQWFHFESRFYKDRRRYS